MVKRERKDCRPNCRTNLQVYQGAAHSGTFKKEELFFLVLQEYIYLYDPIPSIYIARFYFRKYGTQSQCMPIFLPELTLVKIKGCLRRQPLGF
jgi:hypothetical protein